MSVAIGTVLAPVNARICSRGSISANRQWQPACSSGRHPTWDRQRANRPCPYHLQGHAAGAAGPLSTNITAAQSSGAADAAAVELQTEDEEDYEEDEEWEEGDEGEMEYEYDEDADHDKGYGAASSSRAASSAQPLPQHTGPVQYSEENFVDVGLITTPHGIRGEVKVRSMTFDPEERFTGRGNRLYLMPSTSLGARGGNQNVMLRQVTVQHGRMMIAKGDECWVVKFKEVPTRTEAEQLRRCRILMAEEDRPSLEGSGEFYVTDLMGLNVFLQDGTAVGVVVDLLEGTGTYDTLRIQLQPEEDEEPGVRPRTALVPFVEVMCPEVDLQAKRMVINPPEGLLELAAAPKEKEGPAKRKGKWKKRQAGGMREPKQKQPQPS